MSRVMMNGSLVCPCNPDEVAHIVNAVVAHTVACGLWRGFDQAVLPYEKNPVPLSSPADYAAVVDKGALIHARACKKSDTWMQGGLWCDSDSFGLVISSHPSERAGQLALSFSLRLNLDASLASDKSLIKGFYRFWLGLRSSLPVPLMLGGDCRVLLVGVDYPRGRPPPDRIGWEPALMYVIDRSCIHERSMQQQRRYLDGPLPDWVQRYEHENIVVDVWLDNLALNNEVTRRLAEQEAWLRDRLDLLPEQGWNTFGDELIDTSSLQDARPILTFYDPTTSWGFKGTVPFEDRLDEDAIAEALACLRAKSLPDGRPLLALDLIFPSRESVVSLGPETKALGIARALWVSNEGNLWSVHL